MELKNERGGSLLVVVIGIMLIFIILGVSLININSNNNKHISISEKKIIATNIAEIGVKNLETIVKTILEQNKKVDSNQLLLVLSNRIQEDTPYKIDNDSYFTYKIIENNVADRDIFHTTIEVIGYRFDRKSSINVKFQTQKSFSFPEPIGNVINSISSKINNQWTDTYVNGSLWLRANSDLRVNGNFYVKEKLTMDANTNLIVTGSSHVTMIDVKENNTGNGNLGFFCTEHTLYLYSNSIENINHLGSNTCVNLNNRKPPANGIYAKDVIRIYDLYEWNKNKLKIEYTYK